MGLQSRRLPIIFRVYFVIIGIVKPASNLFLLYSNPLDVVYASYGLAGFALLIYQMLLYPILPLSILYDRLGGYVLYVILAVLASEIAMLALAIASPALVVTGGYALFSIMNIMILALSILAYMVSPRSTVNIQ